MYSVLFTLLLAFVCAVYALVGGIAAIITRHPLLVKSTRQAGMATCVLIFIATFSLEYLLFTDNFSQAYVVSHSNRELSAFYKVAALWSGQEGSLLFWSFLLSIYVISFLIDNLNKNGEHMPYVGVVLAGVQTFNLTLNNFVESPFKTLATVNASGVLQNPSPAWMATVSIPSCNTRKWLFTRQISIPAIRASRFLSRLRWPHCSRAIPAKNGFTLLANGP